ncbi:hypothetical protein PILCRDRAFT_10611 [Piloderma croceum F 1598]|uniref:Cytochrome P450 n=1 Tax=Piloderma croceum (strain F 1598) TaxID=765440 RepID=A0A0C3F374_PILCF|nr:hypothetical protein PILCRDRAFT_10611 [Piloderma croceum F 1598]
MAPIQQTFFEVIILLAGLWLLSKGVRILRRPAKTTRLKGPESKSLVFGNSRFLSSQQDVAPVLEEWAERYEAMFRIPEVLGRTTIILCDPKAIQHFYSKETYVYVHDALGKALTADILASVFFDSAYMVKEAWDSILDSSENGEAVIDVQDWMNHVALDSVGIGGFSHDFGTLRGECSTIAEIFDSFGKLKPTVLQILLLVLSTAFPVLTHLRPSKSLVRKFKLAAEEISMELLQKARKEKEGIVEGKEDHSIIGLLVKAASDDSELHMSEDEVIAQMKVLILAGYETISISLTWALIELSKNQSFQTTLREELVAHYSKGGDPTYDQLTNDLPYLDAVVHEVLRLHAPLWQTNRVAAEDDIIPLSVPIQTADDKTVDRVSIAAGQAITVPIRTVNRSISIWGADAKEFKPQRWLEEGGIQEKAVEIRGYRHLLTFVDGPRTCLGKGFALTEFKATLSVLVRNYTFELRDGPDTEFEMGKTILPRPKVSGEDGCRMPLRIRRVD